MLEIGEVVEQDVRRHIHRRRSNMFRHVASTPQLSPWPGRSGTGSSGSGVPSG
jgi:hypothetical protein